VALTIGGHYRIEVKNAVASLMSYPPMTVQYYDQGPGSHPDTVTPTDIGKLIVIEPLQQRVAIGLLEAGESAPWKLVGVQDRLEDAEPGGDLYERATLLFKYFDDVPGVSFAIASKLLHLKRPGFYPLLDSVLRKVYDAAAAAAYTTSTGKQAGKRAGRLYWAAVRADLVDPENIAALEKIRGQLKKMDDAQADRLLRVNDLRLLDMLAWTVGTDRVRHE
jgi:hypothetical protein